jgi:hypothetical protein
VPIKKITMPDLKAQKVDLNTFKMLLRKKEYYTL